MVKRHYLPLSLTQSICFFFFFLPLSEVNSLNWRVQSDFFIKKNSYQVPPLVVKKTGIVVSPLISLMQDQVN